jgi:spermidine dehydrogenase
VNDGRDRELGMGRGITRRDFLNGVALTAGAAMLPSRLLAAADMEARREQSPGYYPPALTGLRGSHPGSFDAAHSLRDGTFWEQAGTPLETGETYDLAVVGGGISGLSAAHFFRKAAGSNARVLVLDNHDDFGGHAKRNEFSAGPRTMLGFGGTFAIESPAPYSPVAKALIRELGIDVASYPKYVNENLYRSCGLYPKIFFDKETFGADRLVINPMTRISGESQDSPAGAAALASFLREAPLSSQAKADYDRLVTEIAREKSPPRADELQQLPGGRRRSKS